MKKLIFFCFLISCSQVVVPPKKNKRSGPYPRIESGIARVCGVSQEIDGYEERYIFDCKEDYSKDSRVAAGYGFRSKAGHPYTTGIRSPYPGRKVGRSIDMISRNLALNETYLYVIDSAGGPDSHDIKSVIYLLPRRDIPKVTESGSEVELLLPTGERVSFAAQTGAITGGALEEGPIDVTREYKKRKAPNVRYAGDYVSIRLDHAFEEPTLAAEFAQIRQKDKTCTISRTKLFSHEGRLLTKSDEDLLVILNRECPMNFEF